MDYCFLTAVTVLLLAVVSSGRVEELTQVHDLMDHENINSYIKHHVQKRSVSTLPNDNNLDDEAEGIQSLSSDNEQDKRGGLFRFGKRQGSLFRFGKRQGSLFRFGKRQGLFRYGKRGSLFRFGKRSPLGFIYGKRGGSIFRFGRSESPEIPYESSEIDKRIFRYGKRSDLDTIRDTLVQNRYTDSSPDLEVADNQLDKDSSQWGSDYDHE